VHVQVDARAAVVQALHTQVAVALGWKERLEVEHRSVKARTDAVEGPLRR
jgi:hypothetical protein